jgi:anhydro-N-acetylmuramic acid kinase
MSFYTVIGLMSGTSMDGLDIVLTRFEFTDKEVYSYHVQHAKTFKYAESILKSLLKSTELSATELLLLDKELGGFFANCINFFIEENNIDRSTISAIASHGHTIFHQPEKGFTYQIGCGDTIAFKTGITVINDFRQKDVIAGGQGAPLVPVGDQLIYNKQAEAFLNIGGFCNISIPSDNTIAFDICPGNLPLNKASKSLGLPFDFGGNLSKEGNIDQSILAQLNQLEYYNCTPPKSLGTEWLTEHFYPLFDQISSSKDQLRTMTEHIATQIATVCNSHNLKSLLVTGGGALNDFLITETQSKTRCRLIKPSRIDIEFKEAIIFGLLGALYLDKKTNTLASVTGASKDVIGGVLHLP